MIYVRPKELDTDLVHIRDNVKEIADRSHAWLVIARVNPRNYFISLWYLERAKPAWIVQDYKSDRLM